MDLQSMSYEMLMFHYITNKEAFDKARYNIKAIEDEMKRRKSIIIDKNRAGKLEYELSPEMKKVLEVEEVGEHIREDAEMQSRTTESES